MTPLASFPPTQESARARLAAVRPGPLPESAYTPEVPTDIRQARTGVPVIDEAVRTLYATGYLHNHARMWLASYMVHLRKVHWRAGADWLVAHLLDGDLASNHLSWQWVAGTASRKPYLCNAENVARYAPAAWHSAGSVLDTSYEALDALARDPRSTGPCASFFTWWKRVRHGTRDLADLPGLASLLAGGGAGPMFDQSSGTPAIHHIDESP